MIHKVGDAGAVKVRIDFEVNGHRWDMKDSYPWRELQIVLW